MNKIEAISEQIKNLSQPPVDQWHPDRVGEIDIHINSQGHWFHEGDPIQRASLVKLFASILWHEDGQYFLVTPAEKLAIKVDDTPLLINQCELIEGVWLVTDNVLNQTVVDAEHPVELRDFNGQALPYVNLRYDIWARVSRGVYTQWVEHALEQQPVADVQSQNNIESMQQHGLMLQSGDYEFLVAAWDPQSVGEK